MYKLRTLGKEPLTGQIYQERKKKRIIYRKVSPAEQDEKRLATQLSNLRKHLTSEEREELNTIRDQGFQMLVDTVEMFVRSNGQLPSDPPLSVQTMPPDNLRDDVRDWTLAHESCGWHSA